MGRVVTVLAGPPPQAQRRDDAAIDAVKGRLQKLVSPDYVLRSAYSLQELLAVLWQDREEHPGEPPELVQIVGHGRPGILSLGSHWLGGKSDETIDKVRWVYLIDSNVDRYQTVLRAVTPPTKVWLLGCTVGSTIQSSSVASGPTLLFDLAQLWGCAVSAPVVYVQPGDFDEKDGRYSHPKRMITACDRSVTEDPPAAVVSGEREGTGALGYALRK